MFPRSAGICPGSNRLWLCPAGVAPPLPGPPSATPPPCRPWRQLAGATAARRSPNTAPSCCERRICPRRRRCTTRSPTRRRSPPISMPAVSRCSGQVTSRRGVNAPPRSPAGSYYASTLHPPHKSCMAQFLRSSNVPESSLPPSASAPSSFAGDPQAAHPHAASSPGYPSRERMGPPSFHAHPGQPQYGPLVAAHGVYAPLYDSRRVWRPQVSPRPDWQRPDCRADRRLRSCTTGRTPGATRCRWRCCTPPSTSLRSGRGSTRWTATTAPPPPSAGPACAG